MLKFYAYKTCSTCIQARKFLLEHELDFLEIPIVDQPPSLRELRQMLEHLEARGGSIQSMLNSSGEQYRSLKLAEKIKSGLSETAILELLAGNGKLLKRPFVIEGKAFGVVGFKAESWQMLFSTKSV